MKEEIKQLKFDAEKFRREGELDKASKYIYQDIPQKEKDLEKFSKKIEKNIFLKEEVNSQVVAKIVSRWTGIPITSLLASEKDKLLNLESEIKKIVKGQDEAIEVVSNAIRRSRAGISDPEKPIGSFLFMGPTGVGKTEVARQLAKVIFNSDKAIIRLDMSEYSEKHSVAKLIGSPPGYVGFDQGGNLTEAVRKSPYSIILLDEIEKAHKDVFDVFLQIFDEGRLTDSKGRQINFKNTIIIMTSNIGQDLILNKSKPDQKELLNLLIKYFKLEFINRIDEIVTFNQLNSKVYLEIIQKELDLLTNRLEEKNYFIKFRANVVEKIAKEAYDPQFGARPIKRYITKNIDNYIAKLILENKIKPEIKIWLKVDNRNKIAPEKRKIN